MTRDDEPSEISRALERIYDEEAEADRLPSSGLAQRSNYLLPDAVRSVLLSDYMRDQPIPQGVLPARGYRALEREGVRRLGQLAIVQPRDLLRLRSVGITTVLDIKRSVTDWALALLSTSSSVPAPRTAARSVEITEQAEPDLDLDQPLWTALPDGLRQRLQAQATVLTGVSACDIRFGVSGLPAVRLDAFDDMSIADLLGRPLGSLVPLGLAAMLRQLIPRLDALAARIEQPAPIGYELAEVLPPTNRAAKIVRSRWGWDGTLPKTLEEVGREFGLTRERIRQVEKKIHDKRLRGSHAYIPSAESILGLLRELGGAAFEEDLGRAAVERGLAVDVRDVGALPSLARMGFISQQSITRYAGEGQSIVVSLGEQDSTELVLIGAKIRRVLGRRGIASIAEVLAALEEDAIPASAGEIGAVVERTPGIEYLGRRQYFWRPSDPDSAFVKRLEKPLIVLGPQTSHALARSLRRMNRRETYGPIISTSVLEEALDASPFFDRVEANRWKWNGPQRQVVLGIAEGPLVQLLQRDGPVLSYSEIRTRLTDVEGVTLSVALSHSPLVERVAQGIYALTGARLLPGDVDDARKRAKDRVPAVQLVEAIWADGDAIVRWIVLDRRLWNGVLNVPKGAGLQGSWHLTSGGQEWATTVGNGSLWGGLPIWLSLQEVHYPARLTLRFNLVDRRIHPEIATLDAEI